MTLNRSLIAAACAVALVAGTAGCGSGDDSATSTASASEAWADNVCGALDTWQTELKSTANDLKSGGVSKDALRGAADDAQSATKTLTDDLQSAGKPDTAAGDEAKQTVDELATSLQSNVDKMEAAAKDVSSVSDVLNAVSVVTGSLTAMGHDLSQAVDKLKALDAKGELNDAFSNSSACQQLDSSTNGNGS